MKINSTLENGRLTLMPVGRVDTVTSPELEAAIVLDGITELVFDMAEIDYISSAGLRVLLASKKKMAGKTMRILNVRPAVREVFEITGFADIFDIA